MLLWLECWNLIRMCLLDAFPPLPTPTLWQIGHRFFLS